MFKTYKAANTKKRATRVLSRSAVITTLLAGSLLSVHAQVSALGFEDSPASVNDQLIGDMFNENCAVCHGESLRGSAQGVALVGRDLKYGDSTPELIDRISKGSPAKGMPAWANVLDDVQIRSLAIYIGEWRENIEGGAYNVSESLDIPKASVLSEEHSFRVETVIDGIESFPFAIAPLVTGAVLVTEKQKGLSVVSPDGKKTLIAGSNKNPESGADNVLITRGLDASNGWTLGVALHPDYKNNGWIYLSYGDICQECEPDKDTGMKPSMTKLVRGRIRNNSWVDEEVIWHTEKENYVIGTDLVSGGRIGFDKDGHVFLAVGMKKFNEGIQELNRPWGKIHRMHNDGRIPKDNPFVDVSGAIKSIWSYGHRNPQGLEFNDLTGELWSSEHGPRGGDEINLILPGRNYGWPLYSLGVNYDGTPVGEDEKKRGIDIDLKDIVQPVVDLSPSPGVSNFVFYRGDRFPQWQDNIIVGSLKANKLYRIVLKDKKLVHKEILLKSIGRVRDVKEGGDGSIYLLIEHGSGGKILKLIPA